MYTTVIDGEDFAIKPMNCPGSILVYELEPHSYRDLPLRYGELGLVHRHELSGALHGMFRVRCFTQDDAHILLAKDQIKDEVIRIARLFDEVYSLFGLPYKIELSTMPEDHIGELEDWELEGARSTLLNNYATVGDSQGKLENFYLGQAATGQHETPADLARAIQDMTAERICRAMSTVKLDTVYFLKGKEAEA